MKPQWSLPPTSKDLTDRFRAWQNGPKMERPNLAESFVPVVGPMWEAAADLQEGHYGRAAFNGAMAVADLVPVGTVFKAARATIKGAPVITGGLKSYNQVRKIYRAEGIAKPGAVEEIHHWNELKGLPHDKPSWKNHPANLKVMPKAEHRRLHGSWDGLPPYKGIERAWRASPEWVKTLPTGLLGYVADSAENLTRAPAHVSPKTKPIR